MTDRKIRELERRWRATGSPADRDAYLRELRRLSPEQVYLVYRTPYEDPGCKRVVKLKGGSVLEWFQLGFQAAAKWKVPEDATEWDINDLAYEWTNKQTKGSVYGLNSIFGAARFHELEPPQSWDALSAVLHEHLYVEGTPDIDEPTVRVLTDDDEIGLAYYLFTQSTVDLAPEKLSYLLHKGWGLPKEAAVTSSFQSPIELPEVEPAGDGEGATYLVDMTVRDGLNLHDLIADRAVRVLRGVRVPDLADYLRRAVVGDCWPRVFNGLRIALGPKEKTLRKAVQRCRDYGTEDLADAAEGAATYPEVREALGKLWAQKDRGLRAMRSEEVRKEARLSITPHLIQLCSWDRWKYDRWIVFDDLWASAHPDLASSLLHYGYHWDPFRT